MRVACIAQQIFSLFFVVVGNLIDNPCLAVRRPHCTLVGMRLLVRKTTALIIRLSMMNSNKMSQRLSYSQLPFGDILSGYDDILQWNKYNYIQQEIRSLEQNGGGGFRFGNALCSVMDAVKRNRGQQAKLRWKKTKNWICANDCDGVQTISVAQPATLY